jgi:hypothetical protein
VGLSSVYDDLEDDGGIFVLVMLALQVTKERPEEGIE